MIEHDRPTPMTGTDVGVMLALQRETASLRDEWGALLALEGWLLDNERFEQWLELLADDVRYVAPVRRKTTQRFDVRSIDRQPSIVSHFNDSLGELQLRVKRLRTDFSHYTRPASLVRRMISAPVVLDWDERRGEATIASNFMLFRAREEREEVVLVGGRDDIWRRGPAGGWLLARRLIKLDHHFVPPLSILF